MEIERKFLFKNIPFDLNNYDCFYMEQAYISTNPVIRIRSKEDFQEEKSKKYILTIKSKGLMTRQEYEMQISKEEYENLLHKVEGNLIQKKRYLIPVSHGYTLELDVFEGIFSGLIIGEIEYPTEEAAKKYTPSNLEFEEVTFDNTFHNSTLSSMSKEKIYDLFARLNSW